MTQSLGVACNGSPAAHASHLAIQYQSVQELFRHPRNSRKHSSKQIKQIAASIKCFRFLVPILMDSKKQILAGHARLEAAILLGLKEVPTIAIEHLSEYEARALMIADNRLTEISEWNQSLLAEELKTLSESNLDFSLEICGFETGEIDVLIEGLDQVTPGPDPADQLPDTKNQPKVTRPGDLWLLNHHRVLCADAQQEASFKILMDGKGASAIFTDPPYNVRIDGHSSGKGAIKHEDFIMGSGEMTEAEFTNFLVRTLKIQANECRDGALAFVCMDWRHAATLLNAATEAFSELKNLCVWTKDRAGMGSFYRSQHELIFVFKHGTAPHINNVQLGRFGRYRSNVWAYPAASSFSRANEEGNVLALHPTPKPVAMVADAILDCSKRGDIILDSFLGSGTSVVAAEKVGRRCFGLELDPKYVDVVIRRWQNFTGKSAVHAHSSRTFAEIEQEVASVQL